MTANEPDETAASSTEDESWAATVKRWQLSADLAADRYNAPLDLGHNPKVTVHTSNPDNQAGSPSWVLQHLKKVETLVFKEKRDPFARFIKDDKDTPVAADNFSPVSDQFPAAAPGRTDLPRCKVHNVRMQYVPEEDMARCTVNGCKRTAKKQKSFQSLVGAYKGNIPAVYRGVLEFVMDEDGGLYLHLPQVNAVISLASIDAAEWPSDDSPGQQPHNKFMSMTEAMKESARQTAERTKRRAKQMADVEEVAAKQRGRQDQVFGGTRVLGVSLPAHMDSNGAAKVLRIVEMMSKSKVGVGINVEDKVTAAIEALEPCRTNRRTSMLRMYTVRGDLVREEELATTATIPLLEAAQARLDEFSGEVGKHDLPLYAMIDGRPMTLTGVRTQLMAEFRASNMKRMKHY